MTLSSQWLFLRSLTFFLCFQLAFLSTAKTTSYIKGIFALTKLKLEEAVYLYEQIFDIFMQTSKHQVYHTVTSRVF